MDEIRTERCPHCDGLGRVPQDPAVSQAELRAALAERATTGPRRAAFDARVERLEREKAAT
jgi:Ribonuclease G/E